MNSPTESLQLNKDKSIRRIGVLILTQISQESDIIKWVTNLERMIGIKHLIKVKNHNFKIEIMMSFRGIKEECVDYDLVLIYKLPDNETKELLEELKDKDCRDLNWGSTAESAAFISIYDHIFSIVYVGKSKETPVTLIMGSAGTGKSSVLNLLDDSFRLPTGPERKGVSKMPVICEYMGKMDFVDTPGLSEAIGGTYSSEDAMKFILNVFENTWKRLNYIFWVTKYGRLTKEQEEVQSKINEIVLKFTAQVCILFTNFDFDELTSKVNSDINDKKKSMGFPTSHHLLLCAKTLDEIKKEAKAMYAKRRLESKSDLKNLVEKLVQEHLTKVHDPKNFYSEMMDQMLRLKSREAEIMIGGEYRTMTINLTQAIQVGDKTFIVKVDEVDGKAVPFVLIGTSYKEISVDPVVIDGVSICRVMFIVNKELGKLFIRRNVRFDQ